MYEEREDLEEATMINSKANGSYCLLPYSFPIPKYLNRSTNRISFLFPYPKPQKFLSNLSFFTNLQSVKRRVSSSKSCTKNQRKSYHMYPPALVKKRARNLLSSICHKQIAQVLHGEVRLSASLFIFSKCRGYHHSLLLLHRGNEFQRSEV